MPELDRTVVIYGASDDLIEVDGTVPGCDGFSCEQASFVLIGVAGEQTQVRVRYAENGCWAIEVAPVDEDVRMIGCVIEATPTAYSPRAIFEGVASVVKSDA